MQKSILIFGAGLNQLTLIQAAKDLGLVSIVLDPLIDAPGKYLANHFYKVDGQDYETTKFIALKHNIAGIVTSQMENPLRLMAKLSNELGLIFHSREVIEKSLDKWLMKSTFINNNVPCAKGILLGINEVFSKRLIDNLNFPLIIKPKDATSSQGVYKVKQVEEILKYRNTSSSFSKTGDVIIEEFLDGKEYSVEAITYRGNTSIIQITEKFVTPFPRTVEMGHVQPAEITEYEKHTINETVKNAIKAIGINNSASHTEIKLTSQGPKIIEIGARLGGDYISSYLTLHSCGVNMDRAAIEVAIGVEPTINKINRQYSFIKYFELPIGKKVHAVLEWPEIMNSEEVVFADIAVKAGDVIEEITESKKRPGFVIVKGISRKDVLNKASLWENKLKQKIILNDL